LSCPRNDPRLLPRRYVEAQVLAALQAEDGLLAQAVQSGEALAEAARTLIDAEHELDLFINHPELLTLLGETKFVKGVETRQHALDQARSAVAELRTQATLTDELAAGDLLAARPNLNVAEKRRLLHGLLERVVLARATGRGKTPQPPQTTCGRRASH
jgi:hypothetical protein